MSGWTLRINLHLLLRCRRNLLEQETIWVILDMMIPTATCRWVMRMTIWICLMIRQTMGENIGQEAVHLDRGLDM
ncbi:unnamed protein product [Symbiodinium microadriaticum]|nr:unnamed protein product [Symbiodinium microadriaticum]